MIKHNIFCTLLLLSNISYSQVLSNNQIDTMTRSLDKDQANFASLEHQYFGDQIYLQLDNNSPASQGKKLLLTNGLRLSYGQILMLAGDFIGDANHPISSCSLQSPSDCFEKQFSTLAYAKQDIEAGCKNIANQVTVFQSFNEDIDDELKKNRSNGLTDWQFYKQHSSDMNKKLNTISCGGSFISDYLPFGNYLKLAQANYDHFVPDSLFAYKTGHQQALIDAKIGYLAWHDEENTEQASRHLETAYAKNAYASHYLTDSLSAGHMRTPRRQIEKQIFLPKIFNLLLANLMHDEDNVNGLTVVNHHGISWQAFGDGNFFIDKARQQRFMMKQIMQVSADSIYQTYLTGVIPTHYAELDMMPDYSKIDQLNDTAPLFKVIDGTVHKRSNKNRYNHHWLPYWSGLVTLLEY